MTDNKEPMTPNPSTEQPSKAPSSLKTFAILSLVLGAWAFLIGFIPVAGLLFGAVAVATGIIALRRSQSKGMAITGLTLGSIAAFTSLIVTVSFFAGIAASSNKPDLVSSAIARAQSSSKPQTAAGSRSGMGSYCDHIMLHFQQVVNVIAGGGKTSTVKDITDKLKEEGDAFSNGYDAVMVGSEENVALLRDSGQAMLELRVALLNSSDDALTIGDRLLENFSKVKEICAAG